jgi:hypothetical protein
MQSITAIYYLDFIHRPYVLQPQRFKGWLFPRHQVKPTLLDPVNRASFCWWILSIKHAGCTFQLYEDLDELQSEEIILKL